jgi:hypothetical protein
MKITWRAKGLSKLNPDYPLAEIVFLTDNGMTRRWLKVLDFRSTSAILTFPVHGGRNWFRSNGLFEFNGAI